MHGTRGTDVAQPICADTWRDKYRYGDEQAYADTCVRVARALVNPQVDAEFFAEALSAMQDLEVVPAGRILAGAGTDKRVTLINCYVSADIQDSMQSVVDRPGFGIMDALARAAYTQQMGGGIGMDFSTIRPRGAVVKRTQSVSSGVLPFMDMWNAMCATIRSSGARRGAMMGTLGIWHPDIEEFIAAKQARGRLENFNVSVLVTDSFMAAVEADAAWTLTFPVPPAEAVGPDERWTLLSMGGAGRDNEYIYKIVSARDLWRRVIDATFDHAEPGVIFIDRVNAANNLAYCEDIHATNPCFTGDTLVWTIDGPRRFDTLAHAGSTIAVLTQLEDGRLAFRDMTRPRRTRRRARLVEVTLRGSGRKRGSTTTVRCTPDHVFFLLDGTRRRAEDLQPRDRVASVYRSRLAKGYYRLRGAHEELQEHWLVAEYKYGRRPDYPLEHAHHVNGKHGDNSLENVEIVNGSVHNSTHMRGDLNPMRRFPEKNIFARESFAGERNGMFGRKHSAETRAKIGAKTRERDANPMYKERHRAACLNHEVVSVRVLDEREDVYCGAVPATGRFFVWSGEGEGVLVSNCGEQPLPANGACNLGHTNLAVMVDEPFSSQPKFRWDRLARAARVAVDLLDRVLDVTQWPTPEQAAEGTAKRRIGLGFTGLASALQQLGVPYGSPDAVAFVREVARYQAIEAYHASVELAKKRGPFPAFNRDKFLEAPFVRKLPVGIREGIAAHGIRNGVLLSVAPTGTTSLVVGNVSSGIEPVFAHRYRRRVRGADGEMAREYSVYDYGYLKYCQHMDIDPEGPLARKVLTLPAGFVTADQLSVEEHLQMAAAAQEWTDAAISKTINCPADIERGAFEKVYTRAYALGLKGCTTYRPNPASGRGAVLETEAKREEVVPSGEQRAHTQPVAQPPLDKAPMQDVVEGRRYRIKWPHEDCAYYVVITDYQDAAGRRRPFELFISTKSERHSEWVKAFSLMVTAIFRREGDPSFVVDELKSVFAATGGTWVRVPWQKKPKLAPSLVAAIGLRIEEHLRGLGMIAPDEPLAASAAYAPPEVREADAPSMPPSELLDVCYHCGARAVVYSEGCATCHACGRSDCG